jgi:hypothetical protein
MRPNPRLSSLALLADVDLHRVAGGQNVNPADVECMQAAARSAQAFRSGDKEAHAAAQKVETAACANSPLAQSVFNTARAAGLPGPIYTFRRPNE